MTFKRYGFPELLRRGVKFVVIKNGDDYTVGFPRYPGFHAGCVERVLKECGGEFFCAGFVDNVTPQADMLTLRIGSESCDQVFGRSAPVRLPQDWDAFESALLAFLQPLVAAMNQQQQ